MRRGEEKDINEMLEHARMLLDDVFGPDVDHHADAVGSGELHFVAAMERQIEWYLRLDRNRSICWTTRSILTRETILRQQLETEVDTTCTVMNSERSDLVSSRCLFKDGQKDVTRGILHLLSKRFTHCNDCITRLDDNLTAVIICLRLRHDLTLPTALHSPNLIFIVISPPVIRCPSVLRISFLLEYSSHPPTPNL